MNTFKIATKFFVVLSCGAFITEAESTTNLFETAKQQYLRSFPIVREEKPQEKKDENKKICLEVRELSEREQREIVFDLVSKIKFLHLQSTFIDQALLKNLEIFCGGEDSSQNLFNTIKRTKTVAGEAGLAQLISAPTSNIELLKERQEAVQELLANPELFEQLEIIFDEIKKVESDFLSYWDKENPMNEEIFKKVYFGSYFDRFNKNPHILEARVRLEQFMQGLGLVSLPLGIGTELGIIEYINAKADNDPISKTEAFGRGLGKVIKAFDPRLKACADGNPHAQPQTIGDLFYSFDNIPNTNFTPFQLKAGIIGSLAYFIGIQVYADYQIYIDAKLKADIAKHLQSRLIATASFVRQVKKLYFLVQENSVLQSLLTQEFNSSGSKGFKNLLNILDHNTFKGNPSMFSLTGRVLAAHKIMKDVKDEFAPFIEFAGRVEALLSIAKLYQEHEAKPARYCFANFIENAEMPYVLAQNFWNPFINPEIVVCNSIVLGDQKPNNIILTGPNTGGKSTVIKGLQLNLLLAQTLGIVPADQLVLTPFTVINCSLNVADDTSGGVSLFKAEVLRAKTIMERIRALQPYQFAYTIMDEVFSGTSPKEGEQAALRYARELARCENSMCTIATHFALMPDLEQEGAYKNYKVSVHKNEQGKIVRPFKLEEGKSELNIAMDLLEEEGIFSSAA